MGTRHQARAGRRLWGAVAAALAMTMMVAGCTGPTGPSTPGAEAKRLVLGATAEPDSMDPTGSSAAAGSQVLLYNVYETLVKIDADGELRPLLAQQWVLSEDRTTNTFHLNPAAKFSDGDPVSAEAVVANLDRVRNGSGVLKKYKDPFTVISSTRAVDASTVEVKLSRASNRWLYELASTSGVIVNPKGFAMLATQSAGSGPYALKTWVQGDSVTLAKSPAYWGTPPRFDEVVFRYFADPNAMNAAMQSDQLDIITNLQAPDAITSFQDASRFEIIEGSTTGEVVLGLNNQTPALKDLRVRQAITMAIDRKALLERVWNNKGTLIGSMSVPTDPYYEDLTATNAYNPEKARALLKAAGYENKLTLRLKPPTLPYATKSAQFVASQLKAVGITATIEEVQFPTRWLDVVYEKADYDMTIVAHVEPRDIVNFANPNYYWRYNNPVFNKLIAQADQATPEQYVTDMKAAAKVLANDAAAVWLFALPNLVIARVGVTGVGKNQTSLSFDVTTIAKV